MKALITSKCINKCPDYIKPFHIYTDASNYQLSAAIIQNRSPITYWSKKFTDTQHNYTTTEKRSVIVICLEEYYKILQGGVVHAYTNH